MALSKTSNTAHWFDYLVFAASLLLCCAIGLYFALTGGRQRTTSEFLMGDRNMRLLPVSASLVVSFLSAITILGLPAEVYLNGTAFHFVIVGVTLAHLLAIFVVVPLFYPMRLTSAFEYLEMRFNSRSVRCLASFLNIVSMTMYIGFAMFAPCTAVEIVTGGMIKREYAIAVSGVAATFYTLLGGIKAVVWVDAIQSIIMLAGVIAVASKAVIDSGGWQKIFDVAGDNSRLQLPSMSIDPRERHSWWGLVIGTGVHWLSVFTTNQASVQRFCSLPTLRKAQLSFIIGIPSHIFMMSACSITGLAVFAYYAAADCDIIRAGWASKNQLVTYFVIDRMSVPGFPGIFTACLFAGALSSISSSLSACAAITWEDVLHPFFCSQVSEVAATRSVKSLVAVFGFLGTFFAYIATMMGGTIIQAGTAFNGSITGPSLGMFVLGCLLPQVGWLGCLLGPIAGVAICFCLSIGSYAVRTQDAQLPSNVTGCLGDLLNATAAAADGGDGDGGEVGYVNFATNYVFRVSYLWYPLIGVTVTVVVGVVVSAIANCLLPQQQQQQAESISSSLLLWPARSCCSSAIRVEAEDGIEKFRAADVDVDADVDAAVPLKQRQKKQQQQEPDVSVVAAAENGMKM